MTNIVSPSHFRLIATGPSTFLTMMNVHCRSSWIIPHREVSELYTLNLDIAPCGFRNYEWAKAMTRNNFVKLGNSFYVFYVMGLSRVIHIFLSKDHTLIFQSERMNQALWNSKWKSLRISASQVAISCASAQVMLWIDFVSRLDIHVPKADDWINN